MGAMQALQVRGAIDRFDYLSSVSGGGYAAATLLAWQRDGNSFPFETNGDLTDPPAVRHIRDHSRYLMPRGFLDLLDSIAVVLRGLVVSASLVVAPMLLIAALTVWLNHDRGALDAAHLALVPLPLDWPQGWVGTSIGLVVTVGFLFAWALARSRVENRGGDPEFKGDWPVLTRITLTAVLIVAVLEFQPRVIAGFVALSGEQAADPASGFGLVILDWIKRVTALLVPLAGVAALVLRQIQTVAKTNEASTSKSGVAAHFVAQALLVLLAVALPLILWVSYLYLAFWGVEGATGNLDHAPSWLSGIAATLTRGGDGLALLYAAFGAALLLATWPLEPNANSLHRLYRDRLARAFVFRPLPAGKPSTDEVEVITPPRLSSLRTPASPYPLINVALNIQGSPEVNKRGRNADFFLFSPCYVGSAATGYAETGDVEKVEPGLNLAAAIAISGAAASPDMGSRTMRALTPTLAILNIRLGYWMRNPRCVSGAAAPPRAAEWWKAKLYLLAEMFGWLDERNRQIYLTDGGHIENLGIYELLKRRCRIVLVIDAEADPELSFSSFVVLQRYARIDFGIRIELPWEAIRQQTRATSRQIRDITAGGPPVDRKNGPHVAVGRILYPNGSIGTLVYVKSSLSGDENDYILNYKARNPTFPHEATVDQFFSEEQFEAYRALGFHCALGADLGALGIAAQFPEEPSGGRAETGAAALPEYDNTTQLGDPGAAPSGSSSRKLRKRR